MQVGISSDAAASSRGGAGAGGAGAGARGAGARGAGAGGAGAGGAGTSRGRQPATAYVLGEWTAELSEAHVACVE